jgi:hypothetical protein
MPTKEWMTKKSSKGEWWMKKRESIRHKRIDQKGKTKTISLLLHNCFGI